MEASGIGTTPDLFRALQFQSEVETVRYNHPRGSEDLQSGLLGPQLGPDTLAGLRDLLGRVSTLCISTVYLPLLADIDFTYPDVVNNSNLAT